MKRTFYIICFTLLGILVQFLVHAIAELGMIALLLKNFNVYGLGLSWRQWFAIHEALSVVLLVLGAWWGYTAGVKFWNIIYVEKRYGWPPKWKKAVGEL